MMNQDFQKTLDMYRQNLTEYKLTGNSVYKTSADTAKAWLDSYVEALQKESQNQANSINNFVSQYQRTNPELIEIQKRIKKVQKEGPELQDIYETEKEAQQQEAVDYTRYYVKAGIIVGVLSVFAVVSFL